MFNSLEDQWKDIWKHHVATFNNAYNETIHPNIGFSTYFLLVYVILKAAYYRAPRKFLLKVQIIVGFHIHVFLNVA